MNVPNNVNECPSADPTRDGVNPVEPVGSRSFLSVSQSWRPKNAPVCETRTATLSRGALRLINRKTGDAHSVDELDERNHVVSATAPVSAAQGTGILTLGDAATNGQVVVLGDQTYTFVTALSAGPVVPNQIVVSGVAATDITHLLTAIAGVSVATATHSVTATHPAATAAVGTTTANLVAKSIAYDTTGNLTSTTTIATSSWSAATLTGGTAGTAAEFVGQRQIVGTSAPFLTYACMQVLPVVWQQTVSADASGAVGISSILFADASAQILTANSFSGGAVAGQLYVHDGVTPGGKVFAPTVRNVIRQQFNFPAGRMSRQVYTLALKGAATSDQTVTASVTLASVVTAVTVVVPNGSDGNTSAALIVAALNANGTVAARCVARSFGTLMQLQRLTNDNDGTFLVAITSTGNLVSATGDTTQKVVLEIGRFNLTAAEMIAGAKYMIAGKVFHTHAYNGSDASTATSQLVFRTTASCQNGNATSSLAGGSILNLPKNATNKFFGKVELNCRAIVVDDGGGTLGRLRLDTATTGGTSVGVTFNLNDDSTLTYTFTASPTDQSSLLAKGPINVVADVIVLIEAPINLAFEQVCAGYIELTLTPATW